MSKYIIDETNPYAIEILKFMGAKELIQCKDCKFFLPEQVNPNVSDGCLEFADRIITGEDWCSRGRRKK